MSGTEEGARKELFSQLPTSTVTIYTLCGTFLFTRAFITKATNLSQINFSSAGFNEIRRNNFPVTDSCVECFEYQATYPSSCLSKLLPQECKR